MAKAFISYRRADSAPSSGRIYDHLVARFGKKNIFKDVDNIPPGADFADDIQRTMRDSTVVLVVIGPRWLDARDAAGARRLDAPADYVRMEIETAFALDLRVIPLLVDGAAMPEATALPPTLARLARLNALPVRNDPDFARDIERVIAAMERAFSDARNDARGETQPTAGGGLFGGWRARSPRAEPSPRAPTPSASTPAAASAADASSVVASPSVARRAPRGPLRARVPLFAGLGAAVVLVSAVAVVLTSGVLAGGARSTGFSTPSASQATQTALVRAGQTRLAQITQTAVALFPYHAAAPGPGCDARYADWQPNSGFSGTDQCVPNATHPDHTRAVPNSKDLYGLVYNLSKMAVPQAITVSVQFSNLSSNDSLTFQVYGQANRGITYAFYVSDGAYTASAYTESAGLINVPGGSGTFSQGGTHTLAITIKGTAVTYRLDNRTIASLTEAIPPTINQLQVIKNGSSDPVDLANLAIVAA